MERRIMRTTEEILNLVNNSYAAWEAAGWEWNPSSSQEEEDWKEVTGVAWQEVLEAEGLMTGYLWCTGGFWCGSRRMVVNHTTQELEFWHGKEERDALFTSLGKVIQEVSFGVSYREASWEVRNVPEGAKEAYEAWTGRREPFQNLSKGWRRFIESLQEEEARLLLKKWEGLPKVEEGLGGWERKLWRKIEGDLVNHPRKPAGWERKLLELMLLEPSTGWIEESSWKWVTFFGVKKAWDLLDAAPSVWELVDLANEVWGIGEGNMIEGLRIPSSWGKAVEYRRKLVQKYQGWDPGVDVELPPPPELPRVEGVEVKVIASTSQLLELGKEYNNCLRTVVGRVLSGALLVWEVIDQESGEKALLGAERKEKEWECGDALFRGINDAEIKSPQLWEQRKAALDTLNAQ